MPAKKETPNEAGKKSSRRGGIGRKNPHTHTQRQSPIGKNTKKLELPGPGTKKKGGNLKTVFEGKESVRRKKGATEKWGRFKIGRRPEGGKGGRQGFEKRQEGEKRRLANLKKTA